MSESLKTKIKNLEPWYHDIDLGNSHRTGNKDNPHLVDVKRRWESFSEFLPEDMTGYSILDVGCNSGYFSVRCKQRGAERVVSLDVTDININQTKFLSEHFKVDLEIIKNDIHHYVLTADEHFDYILFSRVFYHLRYPVLVLDRLAEMTKKRMIFLTDYIPNKEIMPRKDNVDWKEKSVFNNPDYPSMSFIENSYLGDYSNWWIPNESCCYALIRDAGMKIVASPEKGMYICEPNENIKKIILKHDKISLPPTDISYRTFRNSS